MIRNLPVAKTLHLPVALDRPLRQSGSTAIQATRAVHADREAARTGPECFPAYSWCTVEFAAQVLGQASEFPEFGLAGQVARNYATAESEDRTANCRILAIL